MRRYELTDQEWERIAPLLPPTHSKKRGHPYKDHRPVVNGIVWVLRSGAPWEDMPERYGSYKTAFDRFTRWSRNGTWNKVLQAVQIEANSAGEIDWQTQYVDASNVRAHQHAAGARKRSAKPLKRGIGSLSALVRPAKTSAEVEAD